MDSLEFVRIEDGLYTIDEFNDERLYVIGSILLDDATRNGVKSALKFAPELGLGESKDIKTVESKVTISPKSENKVYITFTNTEHKEPLETDMEIAQLLDLIDAYEDALDEGPETITLTRSQDTFTLTTD